MSLSRQIYKVLLTPLLLTGIGTLVCSVLIYNSLAQLQTSVNEYIQKKEYVEKLYANLGYGGGIHTFKNYVIRGDDDYRITAIVKLQEAREAIRGYRELTFASAAEREQLEIIESVVILYQDRIEVARQLRAEAQDVVAIDRQVRVNDNPAVIALSELENLLEGNYQKVTADLRASTVKSISFLLVIFSLTVLLSWLLAQRYAKMMVRSVNRVTELSNAIAEGRGVLADNSDSNYGNREMNQLADDIVAMGQSIRTYVDELQIKAQLEYSLQQLTLLFTHHDNADEVVNDILFRVSQQFNAAAGGLYLIEGDKITLSANCGITTLDAQRPLPHTEFLTKLIEANKYQIVSELPDDFWRLSSPLGDARPNALLYIPLSNGGVALGVIELAVAYTELAEISETVEKFSDVLNQGLLSLKIREENRRLLLASQAQTEELESQQEELRVTNEELQNQSRELELKTASLNNSNSELNQIRLDLEAKADELTKINRYKSEFLANMSHEFRTPLNSLMVLSSLLLERETGLSSKHRDYLKSINQSGNDLLLLVEDILDLTKIEARKISLNVEAFPLNDFIEEVDVSFAPLFAQTGVKWSIDMPIRTGIAVLHTDRNRLKQVLRNLVSNAFKFTREGHVSLRVSVTDESTVQFVVEDTGIGIDAEKQNKIFEAFEQEDASIDRAYGGTGLGLTISRQLAALLKGNITLVSEKGKGSVFTLTISTKIEQPEPVQWSQKKSQEASQSWQTQSKPNFTTEMGDAGEVKQLKARVSELDDNKRTVLIVEDDVAFAQAVASVSEEQGMQAIIVGSGESALGLLDTFTPDAVLLDIKLPNLSGMAILESLKSNVRTRHIPVHMISALDYQTNALRMGAVGYLTKPMTIDKVTAALERVRRILSSPSRRILLVEDSPEQQKAILGLLEAENTEVVVCGYGEEAIASLSRTDYDTIVLDLSLPDTTGLQFLEKINQLDISLPPIVIYTAKELGEDEEAMLLKLSHSIILKGARSPERLLDEINLFLHRVESDLRPEQQKLLQQSRTTIQELSGYKVLLVDDDMRNIFALTSALESRGCDVVIAKDGQEALNLLGSENQLDLVLTDIMMPVMNGYELIRAIREGKVEKYQNLPIVALTAKAGEEDHEQVIASGANDYLAKPLNLSALMSVLRVWLPKQGILR